MKNTPAFLRIYSIDVLRGIAMVLMALDHARDFFTNYYEDPTDLHTATSAAFLTRFVTHFCAPAFIFLAGTSAYLSLQKGKTKRQLALFLCTRGLWLIILEVSLLRLGWHFNFDYGYLFLQVIWAIGCSMIVLAVVIFLPMPIILIGSLLLIGGHHLLDAIAASSFGSAAFVWNILHESGTLTYGNGNQIIVLYPLIPWITVMSAGYCFGVVMQKDTAERKRILLRLGCGITLMFIAIRSINIYGDPAPWTFQSSWWRTILSFVNCQKYPPSLDYLLLTLGPIMLMLYFLESVQNGITRFFLIFGRVPLFYYIVHVFFLHAIGAVVAMLNGFPLSVYCRNDFFYTHPGYSLPVVYIVWMVAIAVLYFPCYWFMKVKMRNKSWWLGYL